MTGALTPLQGDYRYLGPAVARYVVPQNTPAAGMQTAIQNAINLAHGSYSFLLTGMTTPPAVGDTYEITFNSQSTLFTVSALGALAGSPGSITGLVSFTASQNPLIQPGTLARQTGSGDSSIAYTSVFGGAGTVVLPNAYIVPTGTFTIYPGVYFEGAPPVQMYTYPLGTVPDGENDFAGGTVFSGNATFPLFALNNVDAGSVTTPLLQSATQNIGFKNIAATGFTSVFAIGAANLLGVQYGYFENIYIRNCTDWAFNLCNTMHTGFKRCYVVNSQKGYKFRTALPETNLEPGHCWSEGEIYFQGREWSFSVTPANSSATITIPTLSNARYLENGMTVQMTSTLDGFTAYNVLYVVNLDKVAGTFGVSLTSGGSPITASGSTSIVMRPANLLEQGFLWTSDTVATSLNATQKFLGIKSLTQARVPAIAMTGVITNGQANIAVTDGSQFCVMMPVYTSATVGTGAGQITGNQALIVVAVSGNNIQVGNSLSTGAITPNAGGTVTINTQGCANVMITADGSGNCGSSAFELRDMDLEGSPGQVAIWIENCGLSVFDIPVTPNPVSGYAGIVMRNSPGCYVWCPTAVAWDIDNASSNSQVHGIYATPLQRQGVGLGYNSTLSVAEFRGQGGFINGPLSDLQWRSTGQFMYPNLPMGEHYSSSGNQTGTLTPTQSGVNIINRGSISTRVLPWLTTDATPNLSALGVVFDFANVGAFPTVILSESQASVSGLSTAPVVGDAYSTGSSASAAIVTIEAVNVTGVAPNIAGTIMVAVGPTVANPTGFTNPPASSGTWTRVSGTGPASLPYTSYSSQPFNNGNPTQQTASNLQGITWYTMPPRSMLRCVGVSDGANFYWAVAPTPAGFPHSTLAQNTLLAKTTTQAAVTAYTPALAGTFRIGAWATITAVVASSLAITCTYTDENADAQTQTFFPQGLTSASLATTGAFAFPTIEIRSQAGSAITVVATVTPVTSITFDVGASISLVSL